MKINPKERMDTEVHTYLRYHPKELVPRTGDAQRYNIMGLHNSMIPGNIYLSE
jgi:hypothetical protein